MVIVGLPKAAQATPVSQKMRAQGIGNRDERLCFVIGAA
jgi:hypothetical protein